MKKAYEFFAVILLLFLVSCQQNEDITPCEKKIINSQENLSGFIKIGDHRDPLEFMSLEKIQELPEIFKSIEGKTLKNPTVQTLPTKGTGYIDGKWRLQEGDVPLPLKIEDGYVYIDVIIIYDPIIGTFSTEIRYRFSSESTDAYTRGYYSTNNREIYINSDSKYWIFTDPNVKFTVPLKNTPNYKYATISLPIYMEWQKEQFPYPCEILIIQKEIQVYYHN